ncbi:hypothetical protein AYR62_15420 [Secundilactobacillus paracollinoides]|uniref:Heme-binding protein n=1 Tax=Secundilactobacillus paracollinoides TaxID=240427 RepID=A0A1B2IW19_9LACO|nr:heme-binding protein [Secundilactobacillus paracollinoides]ANZ60390.1 hypothetical protein AYR61_02855 [Secundilactobacillus paracollinoides]ANZ65329.1 hypothetical protein AYR62_15420 [Secundilactobacillus paracollinoides]ANZ66219.1 hypothetical protein AYR63_03060 [Secundilactobacillus paracollinoides]KRL75028.1 hypothetical protein FC17_GL002923 [Secundilactobacillus paracollinoides DSM 15502 = JCM 11969]
MANYLQAKQDITLALAQQLVSDGVDAANQAHVKVSIAVLDLSGNLKTFAQMDNAAPVSVQVAIGKAISAIQLQDESGVFEQFVNSGQPAMMTTPGVLPLQGGVPIRADSNVIGAVGVSGSTGDGDLALAREIVAVAEKLLG